MSIISKTIRDSASSSKFRTIWIEENLHIMPLKKFQNGGNHDEVWQRLKMLFISKTIKGRANMYVCVGPWSLLFLAISYKTNSNLL